MEHNLASWWPVAGETDCWWNALGSVSSCRDSARKTSFLTRNCKQKSRKKQPPKDTNLSKSWTQSASPQHPSCNIKCHVSPECQSKYRKPFCVSRTMTADRSLPLLTKFCPCIITHQWTDKGVLPYSISGALKHTFDCHICSTSEGEQWGADRGVLWGEEGGVRGENLASWQLGV